MANYNFEFFKEISCPICRKTIKVKDLPEPKESLNKVAVDHDDHIVVIKYDKFGYIRTIETYTTRKHVDKDKLIIREKCPKCKEEIPITDEGEYPTEYAYKHGDHVVIVNMLERDFYFTEVYPMIKFTRETQEEINVFEVLAKELEEKPFAIILASIAMKLREDLTVPGDIMGKVNRLLEHYGITEIQVSEGELLSLDDKYYGFFLRLIRSYGAKPIKLEEKFKATLLLIEKVINLLRETINRRKYGKQLQGLITKLDQKGIWEVIKYRLMSEYPPEIIAPIT